MTDETSDQPISKCYLGCQTCGRSCQAAQPQNHRFDCCGVIVAHVHGKHRGKYAWWRSSWQSGYATGLSQTRRPAWAK